LDGFATKLAYPTSVITTQIYATTISIIETIYINGVIIPGTTTITAPTSDLTPFPDLTFTFEDQILHWPTTYAAYTRFAHTSVSTDLFAGTCASFSEPVTLGLETSWASLIVPFTDLPVNAALPSQIVQYLAQDPDVDQQLGGTFVSLCDPLQGSTIVNPAPPTLTITIATSVGQNVLRTSTSSTDVPFEAASLGPAPSASQNPTQPESAPAAPPAPGVPSAQPVPGASSVQPAPVVPSVQPAPPASVSGTATAPGTGPGGTTNNPVPGTTNTIPGIGTGTTSHPPGYTGPLSNFASKQLSRMTSPWASTMVVGAFIMIIGWL
jgi:hypothetical protein